MGFEVEKWQDLTCTEYIKMHHILYCFDLNIFFITEIIAQEETSTWGTENPTGLVIGLEGEGVGGFE